MICPSRGRPAAAGELARAWHEVTARARLLIVADEDDPLLPAYTGLGALVRVSGAGPGLGPVLNAAALQVADGADAVGFLGDDHRPRTPGWDELLMAALAVPGVAYGDDLFQRERLPTAVVISAEIIRGLGYMAPPGLTHMYLDNFWKQLGTDLGHLRYLPEVVIEHLHPVAGKARWDEGYARVNSPGMYASDGAAYQRFLAERWPGDLARLREGLA